MDFMDDDNEVRNPNNEEWEKLQKRLEEFLEKLEKYIIENRE